MYGIYSPLTSPPPPNIPQVDQELLAIAREEKLREAETRHSKQRESDRDAKSSSSSSRGARQSAEKTDSSEPIEGAKEEDFESRMLNQIREVGVVYLLHYLLVAVFLPVVFRSGRRWVGSPQWQRRLCGA